MKKVELANVLAERKGLTKKAALEITNEMFAIITETAAKEKVTITGFGTFESKERAERTGRNPKTGEEITIAAHKAVVFKAGKGLKDAANE